MKIGKSKLLAAFLEKDNLKLLVYDVFGTKSTRSFAGQITFSSEVVRDAFIADGGKFTSQVKMAVASKEPLGQVLEVVLFLPADKTFTKALPEEDSIDGFIQSLPYFREELIVSDDRGQPFDLASGKEGTGHRRQKGPGQRKITYVAFEKRLVEDLQRPFLETGKKILSAVSSLNSLAKKFVGDGKYFLLVPFEKEISVAVCDDGAVAQLATFGKDVFLTRFSEFITNHDLGGIRQAYTVGVFEAALAEKLRSDKSLEVAALETRDIYDLVVTSYLSSEANALARLLGKLRLPEMPGFVKNFAGRKYVLLGAAVLVGAFILVSLVKGVGGRLNNSSTKPDTTISSPVPTTPPAPAPKPADFKIRILNGTLLEGEAGRLATKLKDLGFDVTETKNATASAFVASRLRVNSDVPTKIIDDLKAELLTTYDSVQVESLSDEAVGIEIIIGKKK